MAIFYDNSNFQFSIKLFNQTFLDKMPNKRILINIVNNIIQKWILILFYLSFLFLSRPLTTYSPLFLHSHDIGYEIIIVKINFTNVQINSMRFASIVDEPINWIIGSPLTEYRPTFPNALALKTCFTFETCEFLSCDSHKFIRLRLHPTVVKITIGNGITCIYRKSFSRMQIWIRARRLGLFPHFPRLFWLVKTRMVSRR